MAVAVRAVSGQVGPGQLVVVRFGLGMLGAAAIFLARRQAPRIPRPIPWASRGLLGGAAVYCYFLAIRDIGVGPATLLNYAAPIYASTFAVFFLRERPTLHLIGGVLVSTVGAVLVAASTSSSTTHFELGLGAACGIASGMLSGAAMATIRGLRRDTDATTVFLSFCIFGALIGLPFALGDWIPFTAASLLWTLAVGALSFVAQLLFTWGFGYVTASVGSATTQLTPAVSWAMAALLLGEGMKSVTAIGAVVCVAGVLWGAVGFLPPGRKSH
jgi:drug/metabolite transporter (DMT)-like permease